MEESKNTDKVSQSRLIDTLGVATKMDLVFWASLTQSTVWAASSNPWHWAFALIWLVVVITAAAFELADRLR